LNSWKNGVGTRSARGLSAPDDVIVTKHAVSLTPEFWFAVERTFGFCEVPYGLLMLAGDEYARLRRYASSTGIIADGVPCMFSDGCQRTHTVRNHKDRYFGVREYEDSPCQTIKLTRDEATLWQIDCVAIIEEALKLLGVAPGKMEETDSVAVFRVGSVRRPGGTTLPTYLLVSSSRNDFREGVTSLAAAMDAPFVFMSLLSSPIEPASMDILNRRGCVFISLEELVAADSDGNLVLVKSLEQALTKLGFTDRSSNIFRKDGEAWTIAWQGKGFTYVEQIAYTYIRKLLQEQYRQFSLYELLSIPGMPLPDGVEDVASLRDSGFQVGQPLSGNAGHVMDERARREIRAEMRKLDEVMEDAERLGEKERYEQTKAQKDNLRKSLIEAFNESGKPRQTSKEMAKALETVNRAFNRAFKHIRQYHPELADHLEQNIGRGYTRSYHPPSPVEWVVE